MDLKELLKSKLSEKELEHLRKGFDIIGSIAIIEIPKELVKKEKLIAQTLLESNSVIKTVAKKVGIHKGEFRTQKIKIIAGEKNKEGEYKESGCRFKLNVEKCYFSPRLSHERLRIASQIKEGEEILVMFSGVGPYPIVLAKNSPAKKIIGIELNPIAHKYSIENINLNKIQNKVDVYNSDVKKITPLLGMNNIGIKSHWKKKQILNRLKTGTKIVELHLDDKDLEKRFEQIQKTIKFLQEKNIKVMIHQPVYYKDKFFTLGSTKDFATISEATGKLLELIRGFDNCIGIIMQPSMSLGIKTSNKELIQNLKKLFELYPTLIDKIHLENIFNGTFTKAEDIIFVVEQTKLKNICIDTAHFTNAKQNITQLIKLVKSLKDKVNIYFHLADSIGGMYKGRDCVNIGKGIVNFKALEPFIKFGIIETLSKKEEIGKEIIQDYYKFSKIKKPQFDRIIMPLPKNSTDFLKEAFSASKKGTIINFYTFAKENKFDESKKKLLQSCKKLKQKIKIINIVKCGQIAPREFRICIDFEIV